MTERTNEDYWFNVGALAGILATFILVLPLMVITGLIRDLVYWQKIAYGILPMIAYCFLLLAFTDKIIVVCKKSAIKEMDRMEKRKK